MPDLTYEKQLALLLTSTTLNGIEAVYYIASTDMPINRPVGVQEAMLGALLCFHALTYPLMP
ncbi:hypothetical protein SERLADRAFT_468753 [Serpula lacrymans var. lacrymans S7.9]|nr:uncharacterized protein SERLADRAFT_468753 [Serpula lacrymans var. lacrymans S7.9]EGO24843.1 hypothetical protein SERLADRAFT_468753 [Serpula lacrymans var. lacrymans S7.9]